MARRYPQPKELEFSWTRVEEFDGVEVETECLVTLTVSGQDRPARFGPDGGSPPEYAEIDVVAVNVVATGTDIVDDLTTEERAEVEALAEIEAEQYETDQAEAAAAAMEDR